MNDHAEQVEVEDCPSERDPTLEQEKTVKNKEQHNPHSPSTCAAGRQEVENLCGKPSPGRREGWGEDVL